MPIQLRFTSYNVIKQFLKELPDDAYNDARKVFEEVGEDVYKAIQDRADGKGVRRRSGSLYNSIRFNIGGTDLKSLRMSITTNSPYAAAHEEGATIRAKNKYMWLRGGPYMNIPTAANTRSDGRPISDARTLFNTGARIKSGNTGFGIYSGATKMMHLAKVVKIPARLRFRETGVDYFPTLLSRLEEVFLKSKQND